jgi:hypothetical protein
MTADSAEESSLSSKRSWNLKAALSPICLNAGGAEGALGPIEAAQLAASFIVQTSADMARASSRLVHSM